MIGGILNLYDDVSNPPLIISGKQLVLNQGEQNFVQEAVLTGQQFLVEGLATTIQAAENYENIANQIKQTARQQAQSLQNAIPSIINSIALQFVSAFVPGLGGLSVAMGALSSLQKVFQIVADVAQEIPLLQTIAELFNTSYTIDSPVTNQPLLQITSQLSVRPDLAKMIGRFILGAFDPPTDINALAQIVNSLTLAAVNPTKESLNQPAALITNFVNVNLGHYLQSATLKVTTETLVEIPPLEGKLTSFNSALGDLTLLAQSIKSQVASIQTSIATLGDYVSQGVATLNMAQADLDQVLDLGQQQDQQVQSLLDQINSSVLPDLQSLEQFLNSIEQVAQAPVKDLEDGVQTVEDYLDNILVPDLTSLDSSLQTLMSDGQNAESTLSAAISFLNGPVSNVLQTLSGVLSDIYQDLNSGQTGLSTLQEGVSAVEQVLNQKTHVLVDETIDYGTAISGLASALPPNIANFFAAIGSEPIFSPILTPIFLDAAPGSQPAPSSPPAPLTSTDPRLATVLADAEAQWAPAVGGRLPVTITLAVGPLSSGVLAESEVTTWNAEGQPTAGLIIISPDAAGNGWYVDPPGGSSGAFTEALSSTASAAQPGSLAYGEYDLLTALEHENRPSPGVRPLQFRLRSPSSDDRRLAGLRRNRLQHQVTSGGELDPNLYPDDVMAANLAPGVRKLPAALELDVVSTLWGTTLISPSQPAANSPPSLTTTAVDHAVAALGSTPSPIAPVSAATPSTKPPTKGKKAVRSKPHHTTIKMNPAESGHHKKKANPRIVAKPSPPKPKHTPDASVALHLSSRGPIIKPGQHHLPKK